MPPVLRPSRQDREPQQPTSDAPPQLAPAVGGPYAYYVLAVLFVVYIFNFIDRQILAILLEPIKHDLKVSDTALGFLTGFAFAVFYTFAGFFDPVANPPSINARNAGSSVPVLFSLIGYKGSGPFTVASQQVDCASGQPIGALEVASAAGGSGIQYDSANDTYQFNWKTDRQYAQTCRQLVVTLNDGTHHVAYFEFH